MEHVAILNPKMAKVDDVLSGYKTIESRWYKNKTTPWDKIAVGDIVYFKKIGGKISARAEVQNVLQFSNYSKNEIENIYDKYAGKGKINFKTSKEDLVKYAMNKKYIILIFLTNIKSIEPFDINKTGFGISSAWMCVKSINDIKKKQ